jgi:hypothetical protein
MIKSSTMWYFLTGNTVHLYKEVIFTMHIHTEMVPLNNLGRCICPWNFPQILAFFHPYPRPLCYHNGTKECRAGFTMWNKNEWILNNTQKGKKPRLSRKPVNPPLDNRKLTVFWGLMWICVSVCEYLLWWCYKTTVHELNDCTTYKQAMTCWTHIQVHRSNTTFGIMLAWFSNELLSVFYFTVISLLSIMYLYLFCVENRWNTYKEKLFYHIYKQ